VVSRRKENLDTTWCPMPVPIVYLDDEVCHCAERFGGLFSKPQYQYFVTVLLGLMECEGRRTLSGVLREVADPPSVCGLSRFLSEAPWSQQELVTTWPTSCWRKGSTACSSSGNALSPLAKRATKSSVVIVACCFSGSLSSSNPAFNLTPYSACSPLDTA
jgi:hypothetical protein